MIFFKFKKIEDPWSYQKDAISSLIADFRTDIRGRFLLVLPTGGGKTLTAIRFINEMLLKKLITKEDKVLWVVHTLALFKHAKSNLQNEKNYTEFNLDPVLKTLVIVRMKSEAVRDYTNKNAGYKLIIVDEAHHASATTYSKLFENPVGVLGLTATPIRSDLKQLPFKKVSYSVTENDKNWHAMEHKFVLIAVHD